MAQLEQQPPGKLGETGEYISFFQHPYVLRSQLSASFLKTQRDVGTEAIHIPRGLTMQLNHS